MSALVPATSEGVLADPIEAALGEGELVVVSNRQPYRHGYDGDDVVVDRPVGGLTAGLDPVMRRTDGTWVAWGDGDADEAVTDENDRVRVPPETDDYTLRRVWLSDDQIEEYYYGYSNRVLWPLCHGFPTTVSYEERYWRTYREVNEIFADAVGERAGEASVVWLNDYHLGVAPGLIRPQLGDETAIVTFWHIPWPEPTVFRRCPQRRELLRGLLGNDLVGFHVESYCENFRACAATLDETWVNPRTGEIHHPDGTTTVRALPLGVDAAEIERESADLGGERWREFCADHAVDPETRIAVGVDRLDYTKGIPQRIEALERLWERHPEWRGELTYVGKESESRSRIPAYRRLQERVDEAAARVNDRFGTDDWRPVVRVDDRLPPADLRSLYRHGDLALVSALRDGMNLVAQEYVAAQTDDDGALLLSEFAGAHEVLGEEALTINPHDRAEVAARIRRALEMGAAERRTRMRALRERVADHRLDAWLGDLFAAAAEANRERGRP
jgi:trehalose 6-phosphate synthase